MRQDRFSLDFDIVSMRILEAEPDPALSYNESDKCVLSEQAVFIRLS